MPDQSRSFTLPTLSEFRKRMHRRGFVCRTAAWEVDDLNPDTQHATPAMKLHSTVSQAYSLLVVTPRSHLRALFSPQATKPAGIPHLHWGMHCAASGSAECRHVVEARLSRYIPAPPHSVCGVVAYPCLGDEHVRAALPPSATLIAPVSHVQFHLRPSRPMTGRGI